MAPRVWRQLRRGVQIVTLLLFVALSVIAFRDPHPLWSTLFIQLDPLVMATAALAGRTLAAGLWLALGTVVLTLVFGRVWCGWICPLGTVLDWITPRRLRSRGQRRLLPQPPERWRAAKYLLLVVILFAALFGNQTLIFLDPITIAGRTLGAALWPALGYAVHSVQAVLYRYEPLWGILDALDAAIVYPLWRGAQPLFIHTAPIFLLFALIVALNWWTPRFWCRYLCPLGGLLGWLSKWALVRRTVGAECTACSLCATRCPTGTIDPENGFRSDPAECTVCMDCVAVCPREGIAFRRVSPLDRAPQYGYDPRRREVLAGLGIAVAGVSLLQAEPVTQLDPPNLLRPPGAKLVDFTSLCVRCGACVRVCPTQGLQPSLLEGGWQNLLTPTLVPRLGYCLYSCRACAEVCPTGAIPLLPIEEKQVTPIGLARIDRNRCLPWAYDTPCIVCEEMCPVPNKAIRLDEVEATDANGNPITLQRPHIVRDLCVGCGICEYKCPMGGAAAVQVYAQPLSPQR